MIWFLVVVVASGILLFGLVSSGGKTRSPRRNSSLDRELVVTRWQNIEAMTAGGGSGLKSAISEADKLLDYAMRGQGAAGATMAERLKRSETRLSDKESVWQAHKLRNHLAHEVGFEVAAGHAREAIAAYGRALRDLGALK